MLTQEPPVWLWQIDYQTDQATSDYSFEETWKLTPQEEFIKQDFGKHLLTAGIDIDKYRVDAYGYGRWTRQLFSFARLEHGFLYEEDWTRYGLFMEEWNAYCLEHAIISAQTLDNDPTIATTSN